MKLVDNPISLEELRALAEGRFGSLVKAVVDVEKEVMAVDADLHADQEALLLKHGSMQTDLWGINLYPEKYGSDDFVEFDSVINLRPKQNNLSRSVNDSKTQKKILLIVKKLVRK